MPSGPTDEPALWQVAPRARSIPWVRLGFWPTPITAARGELADRLWFKREDLSSPRYGGNKVRTLELALGAALATGATTVWATGAYGSNHALATALHAPTLGLAVGALLFPQPVSLPARANLGALASSGAIQIPVASVLALPLVMAQQRRRDRRAIVMPPGSATAIGALGALSAAIELAMQVDAGELPPPDRIVVPAGSICTSAGLLAGLHLAAAMGLGPARVPMLVAVRVTPWPVTAAFRIVGMARAALALVAPLVAAGLDSRTLRRGLIVDGGHLGMGYGQPSARAGLARSMRNFTPVTAKPRRSRARRPTPDISLRVAQRVAMAYAR